MDVGVGGTNGWFPDGNGDKPWLDGSQSKSWPSFFDSRLTVLNRSCHERLLECKGSMVPHLAPEHRGQGFRYVRAAHGTHLHPFVDSSRFSTATPSRCGNNVEILSTHLAPSIGTIFGFWNVCILGIWFGRIL